MAFINSKITDPVEMLRLIAKRIGDASGSPHFDATEHDNIENLVKRLTPPPAGGKPFWEDELKKQREWIEEHGGDEAGYIERYGSIDDPDHYGHGGEAIWEADNSRLVYLRERVRENS
jgi:hypothetical protein